MFGENQGNVQSLSEEQIRNLYSILQSVKVLHYEQPDVEPVCSDDQLQAGLSAIEDALAIPADSRFKYGDEVPARPDEGRRKEPWERVLEDEEFSEGFSWR